MKVAKNTIKDRARCFTRLEINMDVTITSCHAKITVVPLFILDQTKPGMLKNYSFILIQETLK